MKVVVKHVLGGMLACGHSEVVGREDDVVAALSAWRAVTVDSDLILEQEMGKGGHPPPRINERVADIVRRLPRPMDGVSVKIPTGGSDVSMDPHGVKGPRAEEGPDDSGDARPGKKQCPAPSVQGDSAGVLPGADAGLVTPPSRSPPAGGAVGSAAPPPSV